MPDLDIKNFVKGIDSDIEKEPLLKRFMERFLEEAFQPENINKLSQQYITSITIENFKCIGDAVTIPIRPLTLLFGKNNSGKSTVLQALRYYYAVCNNELDKIVRRSGGYNFDFEDFPTLVHRHEIDRKIRIRIEYASVHNATDKDNTQDQIYQWREVVTGWKNRRTYLVSLLFGFSMNSEELFRFSWEPEETPDDMVVGSNGEKLIRKKQKKEGIPLEKDIPLEIYVNTNPAYKSFIDLCDRINSLQKFEKAFGLTNPDIRHLGPFREVPQTPDKSWEKGFGAWDALLGDSKLLKKTNRYMQDILKLAYIIKNITLDSQERSNITLDINSEIMAHLKKICNSKDIKVDDLKKQVYDPIVQLSRRPVIQLHVYGENKDIEVGLSDIGVGIAQVIPVVVGALDDNHSPGIFAVEQPELHVHPAVQVALGDVFIDSIKSGDSTTVQEASNKFLSVMENCKKELLESIENIHEPAIETILDEIIGLIKDKDPFDVEESLDMVISWIKDEGSLDVQFKDLFKIKEKYGHNIQVAIQEFTQGFLGSIKNTNRTMLIETHSEHLLLRLLRRVRETTRRSRHQTTELEQTAHELTPNDLSVVYVRPTPAGVKFTPLTVTDNGDFDAPWPEGFFDERDSELF